MRYLLSLLLLGQSTIALAQTDKIDEIVTTAQRRDAQFATAGNIAQIGQETLDLISHLHIQETLVRVPGVSFHRNNGQEYLPSIRSAVMSGAGACGTFLSAQDGVPLRAAGFCNVNELFEAFTEQAARIEVVRGPSNALYGSNALHGVINVIMPSVPEQTETRFDLEIGRSSFHRQSISHGQRVGDQGFLVNLTTTSDGGYRRDSGYDQQKLHLRHEMETGDWSIATSFTATNLNQETAGFIEGYKAYEDKRLIKSNPNPEAYRDAKSFRLYSRMEKQMDENSTLVITPYWRKTEMDFLQHFLPQAPVEENGQDSLGVMLTWYEDQSDSFQWLVGLDAEFTEGYLRETQLNPTMGVFPTGRHYDYEVDALQLAPFAQLNWMFAERWTLTAGLRFETMRYDYDNRMNAGSTREDGLSCVSGGVEVPCRYSRPEDRKDSFNNWSPQLGLLYELADNHRLYINLSQGFRAPQTTELYRLQDQQNLADLESEKVESVEIGARGAFDRLAYEFNIYAMDKKNIIFRDPDFRNNLGDGETEHRGVEVSLRYQLSDALELGVVMNYADHHYASEQSLSARNIKGNKEDTAPRHFGTAHLAWQATPTLRSELELVHMGAYYTNPENTQRYEGHDILNLRSSWEPWTQLRLSLNILNLTNKRYAERADWAVVQGVGQHRYFPGEPRSAYLKASYRF